MPDTPQDPIGDLRRSEFDAMAATHHELYLSYIKANFTEEQAMRIVLAVISGGMAGLGGGQ